MPKYKITAPDGKAYVVTAPDGATQEQVLAYAQQHYGQQAGQSSRQDQPQANGLGSDLQNYAAAIGKTVVDQGRGLYQAGLDIADHALSGERAVSQVLGRDDPLSRGVQSAYDQSKQNEALARQRDAPLMNTKAGLAGEITGYGLQMALPAAGLRGTALAEAGLPTTVRGMALQGGVMGATRPLATGEGEGTRLKNLAIGTAAGGVGAAIPVGLAKLATMARTASKPAVSMLDRLAAGTLTREADNPAALSRAAPSAVPGVTRDLAEETLDPGIARLSRNLRSTNKQFDAQDRANNFARVSALEKIAGNDGDYANAEAIRDKVTGQIRDKAFREGGRFDASRAQQNVMRRAVAHGSQINSTKGPLEDHIQAIANANRGRPSVLGTMATVSKAVEDAGDSVAGLYNVRKYIGDLLSGKAGADTSAAQSATRELMGVRDAIDKELMRRAPTFSRYLIAYQDFSKPINRMDIGRDLMDRSSGGAVLSREVDRDTGTQILTPAQFSKKSRDLDAVAAKATGFAKAKATDILAPSDIATIKAIQDDLERQAFRATAGSGGNSQTFERQALQDRMKRGVARGALGHMPVVGRHVGNLLDALDRSRNDRVKERLAYLVANPEEARRVLSALTPAGKKVVSDALTRLGVSVSRVSGPGSTILSETGQQ